MLTDLSHQNKGMQVYFPTEEDAIRLPLHGLHPDIFLLIFITILIVVGWQEETESTRSTPSIMRQPTKTSMPRLENSGGQPQGHPQSQLR